MRVTRETRIEIVERNGHFHGTEYCQLTATRSSRTDASLSSPEDKTYRLELFFLKRSHSVDLSDNDIIRYNNRPVGRY